MAFAAAPVFALIFYSPTPFVYETPYGGAERALAGRQALRFNTKLQAMSTGEKLLRAQPAVTYSVYKLTSDQGMILQGEFPKRVNAEGAVVKFRRRRPPTGGSDDGTLLGVGGMGDDVWRELLERSEWDTLDDAWSTFRKEVLELGRGLEIVDENGDPLDVGGIDYPDEDGIYD